MKPNKDAGQGRYRAKDLKRKKLSVSQQAAVRGGIADGTSHTVLMATRLPAMVRPYTMQNSP